MNSLTGPVDGRLQSLECILEAKAIITISPQMLNVCYKKRPTKLRYVHGPALAQHKTSYHPICTEKVGYHQVMNQLIPARTTT